MAGVVQRRPLFHQTYNHSKTARLSVDLLFLSQTLASAALGALHPAKLLPLPGFQCRQPRRQ